MLNVFEVLGSYKKTVTFSRLYIFLVSALSVLFFFRAKTPEKIENESSSILTVKQCSLTFVPFIRFAYGHLLIQRLYACKSKILIFSS